jgi:LPS O-antigen subunit length determinant protein (WzzB/FepE family)
MLRNNREVEVLGARADQEFFLQSVEPLLAERAHLASISINTAGLKLVNIDQLAIKPLKPVRPKKLLAIFLGLAVGALAAVILVSVRVFTQFYRRAMAFESSPKIGESHD